MAKRLKADERRDGIVHAARKLFAAQGYEATTVEEIAEAAGCTTGPVYHFFGTKREIYSEALRAGIRDSAAQMKVVRRDGDPSNGSALDRLIGSCELLLGLLSIREVTGYTLEAPRVLGFDEYQEIFDGAMLPFIEKDLREAMMNGEIEPESPEPLAVLIAGSIVASANHVANAGTKRKSVEELDRYRQALTRLLSRLRSP